MKLALYSDLHLEMMPSAWRPPQIETDVVILAGDIGTHTHGIRWAAETFLSRSPAPQVIYVAGNHEYDGAQLPGLTQEMRQVAARLGVTFLDNNTLEWEGVRFLGTTLWSDYQLYGSELAVRSLQEARYAISDYSTIRKRGRLIEPRDTVVLHQKASAWLTKELTKPFPGKTVVITHFAPHRGCVATQHEGDLLTPYFTTDMAPLIQRHRIDLWVFGHTHHNVDFGAENGCRVVSNQRGYPRDVALGDNGFRVGLVIEV